MQKNVTNSKQYIKKGALIFALVNFLTFFVYYFCVYTLSNQFTLYFYFYFSELTEAVLPVAASCVLFVLSAKYNIKKTFLNSLFFSLTWILYFFPYYAFEYAYEMLDIYTVLAFSAIHTVFMTLVIYIEITILYLLMIFLTEKIAKRSGIPYRREEILKKSNALDFSNPITVGVFSASAAVFVYNLTNEIIDTVSFLLDVEGAYESGEIIYIVFRYLFILALLMLSHFAAMLIKNKLSDRIN
ncbi:MAG: hypothetical protein E7612_09060 [Ruminococcaceae bacterium]|nr:hypothetical protein [Oscillospiraceae bacterium]